MGSATLLCRHAKLLGATFDQASGSVLVTIQEDGVQSYNLEQRQLHSLTLGNRSGLKFQVTSVQHSERAQACGEQSRLRTVASVLHDSASNSHSLSISNLGGATRPICDAPSRVVLPGPTQSCHFLNSQRETESQHSTTAEGSTCRHVAAVVLTDGRVGVTDLDAAGCAGPLTLLPYDQHPAPRYVLGTSSHDTLLVATQPAMGSPVTLRVMRLAAGAGGLTQVKAVTLPCPSTGGAVAPSHAGLTALTMSPGFALLQWSNGHATAIHGIQGGTAAPLHPCNFPLGDAVLSNGASSSTSAPTATLGATPSGRKRKNATPAANNYAASAAAGISRPRILCTAMDECQFLVLDLESSAAQSQVCFSVHDAQFGCPLLSGTLEIDAPLLSLDASQCALVGSGPEGTVIRLGNSVHVFHVQTQPVSLLSLVARLSVSAAAAIAAGKDVDISKAKAKATGIGGAAVAQAFVTLPSPVSLDPAVTSAQASSSLMASDSAASGATDDTNDLVLESFPAAAINRVDDICNSLIEQLSRPVTTETVQLSKLLGSAVSYIAGRRQHSMPVPPQLLSLTAQGLAAAKMWQQLGAMLFNVPPGGLSSCSDVMLEAVAAQQYFLVVRLAACLDDLEPRALVDVLEAVLAPTTRNNLEARQRHYKALRASALAHLMDAEGALAASLKMRVAMDASGPLALAQCAAAAIDGFSYREVLLHPVVTIPVDAPVVQVALRRLSARAVDALLSYLAKWVVKYTSGCLSDAAASLVLPQELRFPSLHQALEWTRMTIDAHLTRLLMAQTSLPALESMEAALNSTVEGSKRLLMLKGALEHLYAAAPLPAAHFAVAAEYTAEVLDLRVR